jgi:hypothetical protein
MCDVVGMLEGHWPTCFVSVTYSTYFLQWYSFEPHGIIPSFPMQLGGKTVCVEFEVIDAPLNYNLLLGRSWTYSMQAVVAIVL